jgi:hypothetical protein
VFIVEDLAYVLPLDSGLHILDITDPTVPSIVSRLWVADGPTGLCSLAEGKLLVAERAGTHYAIEVLDITDPSSAFVYSDIDVADSPEFISLEGASLLVSQVDSAVIIDVSDDMNLQQLGTVNVGATVATVGLHNNFAYAAKLPTGVKVYDVSTPTVPLYATTISTDFVVMDFTFTGDYMYLATGMGVSVYDVSNPYAPVEQPEYFVGEYTKETMIIGDVLYIVSKNTLETADITDPTSPAYLGDVEIEPVLDLTDISIEGDYAYLQGDGTVPYACTIWPVESPANFGKIYEHAPYGGERDLLVLDGYLYEASLDSGLRIFDLY